MFSKQKNSILQDNFFLACQNGDLDEFDRLIEIGVDPNSEDYFTRQRPIHVAVANGNLELVKKLAIELRVPVDIADGAWRFPMDIAVFNEDSEIQEVLSHRSSAHKASGPSRRLA